MTQNFWCGSTLRQFIHQTLSGIDQSLRCIGIRLFPSVTLHFRCRYPRIAHCPYTELRLLIFIRVLQCLIANITVLTVRSRTTAKSTVLIKFRVGLRHMVGFIKRLECDLPITIEYSPLTPSAAHILKFKWIEHLEYWTQKFSERPAIRIEIDPN